MGYFSWYILINLPGHILRDGVGITLNIIRNRIPESNITPILLKKMVLFILCFYYDVMGYFSWYILINLLGHIHRDGVSVSR